MSPAYSETNKFMAEVAIPAMIVELGLVLQVHYPDIDEHSMVLGSDEIVLLIV